ncbi:MAG TPA: hypothetical protein VFV68_02325 [Agriterribacter sp.]|nr:hypothetical protein [Agriterribacter sp.]
MKNCRNILLVITKKQTNRILLFCSVLFVFCAQRSHAQSVHPHILVKPSDKELVLQKMEHYPWAKKAFEEMLAHVSPYVERHKTDSGWILSRYLMNRVPGKRYTRFYSDDEGTALVRYEGDAPYPTVRVSPNKRPPTTADGYRYKLPAIEELVPYDTSMNMLLESQAPGGKKEWIDPQSFVETINGRINELALEAAIIYWLTRDESFGRFAADILNQWARGASFQSPIEGPCRTGFLAIQTLGDGRYESMPLTYDFLYDYLRQQHYNTSWYEGVFGKMAHTMTFRGFYNNNWFAAQSPAMIFSALSLENKSDRDFYLNFFLNQDTIKGSCGHLSLASVVEKWLTPDGHWKEPGGYHNYPVSNLLVAGLAMENNGYNIFGKYPVLLNASYVLLKYSFPNLIAPSFGDTGPTSQSAACLEIGLLMAKKYEDPIAEQLNAAMDVLTQQKGYKRESSGYMGLLCFLPDIEPVKDISYTWPRSGELDFAKCYLQRNGSDREHGLMYVVQGATYNHNHANGMSVELYGQGMVMGIDPGKGVTYEAPMHVGYYAQWAAHNTVVAGSLSASVPYFKGGGGTKQVGHISLEAMEPGADREAVSPYCSYTDTRYTDKATGAAQQRTLAIVRTSDSAGYYIDIYRSAHPGDNEYLYHNIGTSLQLLNVDRYILSLKTTALPVNKTPFDPPGLRYIKDCRSTGNTDSSIVALFSLKEKGDDKYMQVLFTGEKGRAFYAGDGPSSPTADLPYRDKPTPTLICRQEGEAWTKPFVAIYEPFAGAGNFSVQRIEKEANDSLGNFTAINVYNKEGSRQVIFQSLNSSELQQKNGWRFKGNFGIVNLVNGQLTYLYLGDGNEMGYERYGIIINNGHGAANLVITKNGLQVSCNQEITVSIKGVSAKSVMLSTGGRQKQCAVSKDKEGISFTVAPVINGEILLR